MTELSHSPSIPELGDSEWSAWYLATFSFELGELAPETPNTTNLNTSLASEDAGSLVRTASPGHHQAGSNGAGSTTSSSGSGPTSKVAATLMRRLRAVDAMDGLLEHLFSLGLGYETLPRSRWVRDADVATCAGCHVGLGWVKLKRRHHCRFCGRIFCAACAPGRPRRCGSCDARAARLDMIRRVRALERDAVVVTSRESVLAVARAYRVAIEAFATPSEWDELGSGEAERAADGLEAKQVLVRGLHTFLELSNVVACLRSGAAPTTG